MKKFRKVLIQFDLFGAEVIVGKIPIRKKIKSGKKIEVSSAPVRRKKDLEQINKLFLEKVEKCGGYK